MIMTIEEFLDKPYWVIDILPKQVPADSRGQYFKIEKYFLEHPQIDGIYRKFIHILLKLNCYEYINVSHDGDEWMTNPDPHELEAALLKCMDNPTEESKELIDSLAVSEGLFMWKPNN